MLGDGLGHIAFAGVTGASLLKVYPSAGAVVLTVIAAIVIELLRRYQKEYADMVMALFFYTGLALAIIFSTMTKMPSTGLLNFLFGSILTVTAIDIYSILGTAIIVTITIRYMFKDLILATFDEEVAKTAGVNVDRIHMIFAILTALVVVMGMSVVGILLISALMIVPVAAAHLWKRGFTQTLLISMFYSLLAVLGGLVLSYYGDFAPGGTIVIVSIGLYVLTFAKKIVE